MINYISNLAIPLIILITVIYGLKEKIAIFDVFLDGAKKGMEIVCKIFPTLVGLFLAIGLLRTSGVMDFIVRMVSPITNIFKVPSEIIPLALLRPISRKRISGSWARHNANLWS